MNASLILANKWSPILAQAKQDTAAFSGGTVTAFKAAGAESDALSERLKALVKDFRGDKIITEAEQMAAAVAKVGGPLALTATEQARVNATVQEAVNKYKALGDTAPPELQKLADATAHAAQKQDDLGASLQKTAIGFAAGLVTFTAVKHIFGEVSDFVMGCVEAFGKAEAAQMRLTVALRINGQDTPVVIKQYKDLADELANTSTVERDAAIGMEALLTQIGQVGPADMQRATRAVADLSSGLGIDLESATRMVSRALEGNFMSLKRVGIQIDATTFAAKGMDAVYEAIESRVGGQAQAELETYAGQVKHMGNMWTETKEALGGAIVKSEGMQAVLALLAAAARDVKEATEGSAGSIWALASRFGLLDTATAQYMILMEANIKKTQEEMSVTDALAASLERLARARMQQPGVTISGTPALPIEANPEARINATQLGYLQSLKTATDNLTASEKARIATAMRLNPTESASEIAAGLTLDAAAVGKYVDALKKGEEASKKAAEDAKKVAQRMAELSVTYTGTTSEGKKFIDMLLKEGQTFDEVATYAATYGKVEKLNADIGASIAKAGHTNADIFKEMWGEIGKEYDDWMKGYEDTAVRAAEKIVMVGKTIQGFNFKITDGAKNWKQELRNVDEAFNEMGRVAQQTGNTSMEAFARTGSTVTRIFEKMAEDGATSADKIIAAFQGAALIISELYGDSPSGQIAASTLSSASAGAQVGTSILPGWGTAIGFVVGAAYGFVTGSQSIVKAVNDQRDATFAAAGGYEKLHAQLIAAGNEAAFNKLWNAKNIKEWNAALENANRTLKATADLEALRKQYIPTWDRINAIIEKYGIDLERAGAAAQQLMVNANASTVMNDWETWAKMIGDSADQMDVFAAASAAQFSTLVQQAQQYGTTLPENMRPMIESLIEQGRLLDKNGQKIEDISGITFGAAVETEMERLATAIEDLVAELRILTGSGGFAAVAGAAGSAAGGGFDQLLAAQNARIRSNADVPGFAGGTGGQYVDFGTKTLVALHGPERVMTAAEGRAGGGAQVIEVYLDGDKVADMIVPRLPSRVKFRVGR